MVRYLILGAGTAGKRAAQVIRKMDDPAEITLIDEEAEPFYYRPMLGRLLAKTGGSWVMARDENRFAEIGARLLTKVRVESLDVCNQQVLCSNGQRIPYDRLLVATGRKTRRLSQDLKGAQGLVCLDSLDDAKRMAGLLDSVEKAVVIGSSIQALEALRGLRAAGIETVQLIPEDRLWPGVLDPVADGILEQQLRQEGVKLLRGCDLQEIIVEKRKIKGVLTGKGEKVPADLVVLAAPQSADLNFLRHTDLEVDQGLLVDQALRTKRDNIFAAGDAAQPPAFGGRPPVPQPGWLNAWRQGNVAGMNMAGKTASYVGVPSLRMKAFDLDIVCLGLSDKTGQGIQEESGGYPYEELPYIYKKLVYENRKVAGAIFTGDVSEAGKVEHWIGRGLAVDLCDKQVLDQMFKPRFLGTAALGALCPVCKFQIQVGEAEQAEPVVTCPACGFEFRLERMPNGVFRAAPLRT